VKLIAPKLKALPIGPTDTKSIYLSPRGLSPRGNYTDRATAACRQVSAISC
jgi:hypothetical protein